MAGRTQRGTTGRRWPALLTVVATALALFGSTLDTPATAVGSGIGGSHFDAGDGALDTAGGTVSVTRVTDKPSGNQDDTYAGDGAAEPSLCPAVDLTHAAPQKSDIQSFWYGTDTDAPGVLYLAWDRKFAGGTLAVDFEFNQVKATCGNGVNPIRTDGDIMVVYEFDGGTVHDVQVRIWGSGAWGAPLTGPPLLAQQRSISGDQLFGELAINLSDPAFGILDPAECDAFAIGWAKSRTGNSFDTSKVKDFVAPKQVNVSNCGSLTIVKDARPDAAQDFTFQAGGSSATYGTDVPATLTLDDDADATVSNTAQILAHPQTVTVTEDTIAGWQLTDLSCTGLGSAGVTKSLASRSVSVALKAGDDITCTFVNSQPNTLTIVKDASPDNGRDFAFTGTGTGVAAAFSLDDDAGADATLASSAAFANLAPDTYTVTEGVAAGWSLSGIACAGATVSYQAADGTPAAGAAFVAGHDRVSITLTNGQSPSCTFTNTKTPPTIVTTKTASPTSVDEPGGDVTFGVSVQNTSPLAVALTDLVDDVYGDVTVTTGTIESTTCATGAVLAANGGTYSCSFVAPVSGNAGETHTDVVTARGVDADGVSVEDADDAVVEIDDVLPQIHVVKAVDKTTIHAGDPVVYTYTVTNPGVEPLSVTMADDKCAPVVFVGGDTANPLLLDPSETWTYTCTPSPALTATTTNIVTATGTDDEDNEVSDTDAATVTVIKPAIAIDKTPSATSVDPGTTVVYTYTVTNPGDVALTGVTVADDKCAPVTFVGGDTNGDKALQTTETWTYRCSQVQTGAASTLTNIGTATGTDPLGKVVTATDTVTVSVVAPLVLTQAPTIVPEVVAAPAPTPAPVLATAPVTLPRTGAEVRGWVELGASLVLLGLALLFTARRRRGSLA